MKMDEYLIELLYKGNIRTTGLGRHIRHHAFPSSVQIHLRRHADLA